MKRQIITNIIIVITFFLSEHVLTFLLEWADNLPLGAEMVLGMLTQGFFICFILLILGLIAYSVIKCITKKEIKQLIPAAIIVTGIVGYILIADPNSFWVRVAGYCFNL